jgi:hypothetical protein
VLGTLRSQVKKEKENKTKNEKFGWTVKHRTPVHGPTNCLLSQILAHGGYNSSDRPRGASDSLVCHLANG